MTDAINTTLAVNQADYLKLFMQELTYQDPLKPVDNKEFMAQMAQFSGLQEAQTTNQTLAFMSNRIESNYSLRLLGKKVTVRGSDQEGIVSKIELASDGPPIIHVLMANGENPRVQLSDLTAIWNPASR